MDRFNSVVSPLLAILETWLVRDWLTFSAVVFSLGALVVSAVTARTVRRNLQQAQRIVAQNRDQTSREELRRQIKDNALNLYRVTQLAKSVFAPWQHLNGMDGEVGASMAKIQSGIRKAQREQEKLANLNITDHGHAAIAELLSKIHDVNLFLQKNEEDLKRFEQWASAQPIQTEKR